jgi:hypothetical protein
VVDWFGSNAIRTDLNNVNTQFGLPHMCGEAAHACAAGDPMFDILCVQACTDTKSSPPTANSVGTQDRGAWIVEVSLAEVGACWRARVWPGPGWDMSAHWVAC